MNTPTPLTQGVKPFIDPRHKTLLQTGLATVFLSCLTLTIAGIVAATSSVTLNFLVFFSLLFPGCAVWGVKYRQLTAIAVHCCCSGCMGFLGVVSIIAVLAFDKARAVCICDVTCTALPQFASRGSPGGSNSTLLADLRAEPLYATLCPNQGAYFGRWSAFIALTVIGLLLHFIACAALCIVRGRWSAEQALFAREAMERIFNGGGGMVNPGGMFTDISSNSSSGSSASGRTSLPAPSGQPFDPWAVAAAAPSAAATPAPAAPGSSSAAAPVSPGA